jgi:hypothetical protein
MDFLGRHAGRQHGIGEIDGLRLLTDEQDARHPTLPGKRASLAETTDAHKRIGRTSVLVLGSGVRDGDGSCLDRRCHVPHGIEVEVGSL